MAYDPATYKVNLDTPQPDGRKGESPRNAFTKYNALVEALKNAPPAPSSTTTNKIPQWSNTVGGLKDGLGLSTSSTLSGNSDSNVPSEKAVKTYVDVNTNLSKYGIAPYAKHLDDNDDLNSDSQYGLQLYKWDTSVPSNAPSPSFNFGAGVRLSRNNISWGQLLFRAHSTDPKLFLKTATAGGQTNWEQIIHTGNTDLVVSSGSNANGDWVQFADGTQICYIVDSSNVVTTDTATGNIYFSPNINLTFPKSFLSPPAVTISANHNNSWVWPGYARDVTSSSFSARLYGSLNTSKGYVGAVAIGRWK